MNTDDSAPRAYYAARAPVYDRVYHKPERPADLLIDNSPAQFRELPITATDKHGSTYQTRVTDDHTDYRVLKNFPSCDELTKAIRGLGVAAAYEALEHFWTFRYTAIKQDDSFERAAQSESSSKPISRTKSSTR